MKVTQKAVLNVGSRSSPLAQSQVREVFDQLLRGKVAYCLTTFETQGDRDKDTSLLSQPADNFFTDTLDEALLAGNIDIAIHSAKDLPKHLPRGLKIFALTKALDDTDALVGRAAHSQLQAGSRIGTSSPLRKEQILAFNPKFTIVEIRGTIQERCAQLDAGKVDALIVATCALKRLGLEKRIKEILPWEATPLQGQLAVVGRKKDRDLEKSFYKIDVRRKYGKVFLVGAGPGDPDLFTLKGVECLRKADIVFYDYLVHKSLLDYAPQAEKINVGKRKGDATFPQNELSRLLKSAAQKGQTVVRLKGGDPLIFGRGADEINYLRSYHIDVDVIPGLTSATGIPSSLGIPLTSRGISSSVAFLSGHAHDETGDISSPIKVPDVETLIFYMGLTKLPEIVKTLREKGWMTTTPIAIVSKGTRIEEKVIVGNLANIEKIARRERINPPAIIIVGKTLDSYYAKSSSEKSSLYLGTYPEKYKRMGRIIHFPMINISAAKVDKPREVIAQIKKADMILLTSRCGVKYFFEFLGVQKVSFEILRMKSFIVIGAETQRQLAIYNFSANLVSHDETSVGLFKAIKKNFDLKGKSIIFPRSSIANPYLEQHLTKSGAKVREIVVYNNTKPSRRELPLEKIDQIIFTSPSTVENFLADYKTILKEWKIFAKGKRTQQALKQAGYSAEVLVSP
ncbi:MAG: uroporphyrinogen-III C-methyltransferase [Candidatus Omnitrophica bacterium]|nr:uroporphyrinogen-III C-methyltransferase [Candidatus Omnitrophota bacterium]